MMDFEQLKEHLTAYLDERITVAVKAAVDQANTDIKADLAELRTDVLGIPDDVAKVVQQEISAVGKGVNDILNTFNSLNPFRLGEK